MAADANVNVSNLVQAIVQHPDFQEMFNSVLTATYREQSTNIVLITSTEIWEHEGSISPSSFYGQLPNYYSHVLALSSQETCFSFSSWCN